MPVSIWKDGLDALIRGAIKAAAHGARGIIINNHEQNAQQIRMQVHELAPFFDFIGYDDLKSRLVSRALGRPFCLLTFDDGKAVNATETASELLRLGVPAVFFIVTGLTGTNRTLWFDRLSAVRRAAGGQPLPELAALKVMPWREREQIIDELCASFGIGADITDPAVRVISWDEASRLQNDGFEIGSHTVNHAILTVETHEEARRQIVDSRRDMMQNGLRCRSLAFPNGNASWALVETALEAGFESTMTTAPVWARRRDNLTCLPRLYLKEQADAFYIHTKTLAARTGFALKNPNSTGRRYLFGL